MATPPLGIGETVTSSGFLAVTGATPSADTENSSWKLLTFAAMRSVMRADVRAPSASVGTLQFSTPAAVAQFHVGSSARTNVTPAGNVTDTCMLVAGPNSGMREDPPPSGTPLAMLTPITPSPPAYGVAHDLRADVEHR